MTALPRIVRAADAQALCELAAEEVRAILAATVARSGRCRLALSGGSTPRALYRELALPEGRARVPWAALEIFWSDERVVPQGDLHSNHRMAVEALLAHVPVAETQVHRIEVERGAAEAARHYAELLGDEALDLLLLGMGDDGHTASLFPGDGALASAERVVVGKSPRPPCERVSLSLGTIQRASAVLVLVTGADKARALARAHEQMQRGEPRLPIARVRPKGTLTWMIDEAAATELDRATATAARPRE